MEKEVSISNLMEQIESKLKNCSDISKEDINKLGYIKECIEKFEEKLVTYENTIGIVEAFLLENGLNKAFLNFSNQLIQDFLKDKKTNPTLVN